MGGVFVPPFGPAVRQALPDYFRNFHQAGG
jgi:hypothetical protein